MPVLSSSANVLDTHKGFLTMEDEKTNNLFYGVELECYCRHGYSSIALNLDTKDKEMKAVEDAIVGVAILKDDGDFEIVTVPATLRYHKEQLWNKFFSGAHEGVYGPNGLGLHIHLSRDALTPLQLAKMMCFMHETINHKFLTDIAGRTVNEKVLWCNTRNIVRTVEGAANLRKDKGASMHISGRNAGKTAEVRIFQSDPTQQGLFQALEFVDALVRYCFKHGNLEKEMGSEAFVKWFVETDMKAVYPYLNTNLVRLGYVKEAAQQTKAA